MKLNCCIKLNFKFEVIKLNLNLNNSQLAFKIG